ncbi:M23 family metallopeptidase [Streptomyces sp. NPDC090106]|uniref:M23 family metallopeptidase n=1 Tax=Streptomyces sp. NPDC090106 TaxID=3365946 RepID=UPI00381219F8
MRQRQSIRIPWRFGTATSAALLVALLVAVAAAPASADRIDGTARTAHTVHAYEKARARVDRLKDERAPAERVRSAEDRRKTLRDRLWDELRRSQRALYDPVAVDRSGRAGRCPRGKSPKKKGSWQTPVANYWLTAGFAAGGDRWRHRHTGQDFAVNSGTPVRSVGPGTVWATTCGDGFGNQVLVRHRDGYFTQYAHLSRIDVRKGQRVTAGRRLGLSGATGNVTGPHLHFEVRITPYLGSAVPPLPWLARHGVRVR